MQKRKISSESGQTIFISGAITIINKPTARFKIILPSNGNIFIPICSFCTGSIKKKRPYFFLNMKSGLMCTCCTYIISCR